MGQIEDGLAYFLEFEAPQFIEHEGKDDRYRKTEQDIPKADDKSIFYRPPEIRIPEQHVKVGKAHPGAACNAFVVHELFKGQYNAIHGCIAEDYEKQNTRKDKHINILIIGDLPPKPAPFPGPGSSADTGSNLAQFLHLHCFFHSFISYSLILFYQYGPPLYISIFFDKFDFLLSFLIEDREKTGFGNQRRKI
jgi:hypothetical protein